MNTGLHLVSLILIAFTFFRPAQGVVAQPLPPEAIRGPYHDETLLPTRLTVDLRDLPEASSSEAPSVRPLRRNPFAAKSPASSAAPLVAQIASTAHMPSPLKSFAGINYLNGGSGWPPDPNGDVGPVYYIQAVNTSFAIYLKSTGLQVKALTFNAFFSGAGGQCSYNNRGDPIVVYDQMTDRWLISDFAFNSSAPEQPYYQCIAVSMNGDPVSGGWYLYAYPIGQVNGIDYMNDYPKFGVWTDAIYMSANMYGTDNSYFVRVWALNKAAMYAGQSMGMIYYDLGSAYGTVLPAMLHGQAPPAGTLEFLTTIDLPGILRLWKFKPDFVTPLNSTLTGPTNLSVDAFTSSYTSAPQLNSFETVDTVNDRQMAQLQYQRQGSVESLWATHTVDGNGATAIRWYELRNPNGAPVIYQQGTFQPDAAYRFVPSLAVDKAGNMAVGYTVSSGSMYPAIRYAGRLATDASGLLGQGEATLMAGAGSQSGGYGRWGDYTAMTIDPVDGCTFWYTNEYYATKGNQWQTRIGSFQYPECTVAASVVSGIVSDAARGTPLSAAINIAGYTGGSVTANASGFYSVSLPVGAVYTFTVNASVGGYNPVTRMVSVSTAASTQNFILNADPVSCSAPGYTRTVVSLETFDAASVPALPAGWTTQRVAGTNIVTKWYTSVGTQYPIGSPAHSAPNIVAFNSYSVGSGNSARLVRTSPVNMMTSRTTWLSLWLYHDTGYTIAHDYAQAQVSTDGGATWVNVGASLQRNDGTTGWQYRLMDLSAYANAPSLLVGILGVSQWGNDVNLDDIALQRACRPSQGGKVFMPIGLR
ncbi:MAG TPA: hypothetical protein VGK87_05845 [Anaerolineae bacterium]